MQTVFLSSLGSRGYRFRGPEDYALLGVVSSAGDVNGDGIDDFIVAGNANDTSNHGSGYSYVIYGRADGQFGGINLATLSGSDGFRIHGIADTASSFLNVSSAGDFNGDGYDDVIIGGVNNSNGGAWVVFGAATGRPSVELGALTASQGFFIQGANGDSSGFSVSSAGDINHDGYYDIIVGSPDDSTNAEYSGQAHIIFGKASGFGTINLANFSASDGFVIRGDAAHEFLGSDVASAGDVNGDGIDDLIISAPRASEGNGFQNGGIYLVYGKTTPFGTINLATLGGSDGAIIRGSFQTGDSVAGAGDVNADGYEDLIIGAPMEGHGKVYVVFGKAGGIGTVDVATMTAAQGFSISGGSFDTQAGYAVAGAGDVNGDGYDDMLLSAPFGGNGGNAWLILGKANLTSFNLDDMNVADPPQGFRITGAESGTDAIGRVLSSAGDVNDDGLDDILIGSRDNNGGGFARGASYLIYGLLPTSAVNLTGTVASQRLTGGDFDDQLSGLGGDDILYGNGGADQIDGGTGNDKLKGGAGTDTLTGGDGKDLLDGGAGADTLTGGNGDDVLDGGAGADMVFDDVGNDVATVAGGTTKADTDTELVNLGSDLDRLIVDYSHLTEAVVMANPSYGATGAQTTFEIGGALRLSALGIEALTIATGSGSDEIYGIARSTQTLIDEISTGAGNDSIMSGFGAGIDRIDGGTGVDTATQVDWSDLGAADGVNFDANNAAGVTLGTGSTQRWLRGIEQLINFSSGAGNDVLGLSTNATLRNAVNTGTGSDTVTWHGGATSAATAAASSVNMGTLAGDDDLLIVDFAAATQAVSFEAPPSVDFIGASGAIRINGMTALTFQGVERLWLTTGTGDDELYGATGADRLISGAGNDALIGGAGNDVMTGGLGNDVYYVTESGDVVNEAAGEGSDRVATSVSFALASNAEVELIEAVTRSSTNAMDLGGSDSANTLGGNDGVNILRGEGGNDVLFGYGGADFLVGGDGSDVMVGGLGDDTYYVDGPGDVLSEFAGEGNDRIAASISLALAADADIERIEVVNLTSSNALDLTGSGIGNVIYGNDGINILRGEAGNDELRGFGGDDFLVGGPGTDLMVGGLGNDTFYVDDASDAIGEIAGQGNDRIAASVSFVLSNGADVEVLEAVNVAATTAFDLTGSDSNNTITGNAGVNVLRGEGGNDILSGAGGDDFLVGGAGTDTMNGGTGNDTYYVDAAADVVSEFVGEGASDRVVASVTYALSATADVELLETATQGGTGALDLTGSSIANIINGNDGANVLDGKGGSDVLTGFGGADTFQFTTALGANNVDSILGFVAGSDKIALDDAVFGGIGAPGALGAGAFVTGSAAADVDDRIIYNSATGALLFDADGNGAGAAVQFATIGTGLSLAASDFMVI